MVTNGRRAHVSADGMLRMAMRWLGLHRPTPEEIRSEALEVAASDASEKARLEALLKLDASVDGAFIAEQLARIPAYEHYDLAKGWPHQHRFEPQSAERIPTGQNSSKEHLHYRCACGMTLTKTYRNYRFARSGVCPDCGGEIEQLWYGDYEWFYRCRGCGRETDICEDSFSGVYYEPRTDLQSVSYVMDSAD